MLVACQSAKCERTLRLRLNWYPYIEYRRKQVVDAQGSTPPPNKLGLCTNKQGEAGREARILESIPRLRTTQPEARETRGLT